MAIRSQFSKGDTGKAGSTANSNRVKGGTTAPKKKGVEIGKDTQGNMIAPPEAWAFRERSAGAPVNTWGTRVTNTPPNIGPWDVPGGSAGDANSGVAGAAAHDPNSPYTNPYVPLPSGTTFDGRTITGTPGTPMSGAMADFGYTPQGMMGVYAHPEALTADILAQYGIDNDGLALALADAFNPALLAYMLGTGGSGDMSDNATLNYAADYLQQMVTPGGAVASPGDLMASLFGLGGGDSMLGSTIAGMTPEDQAKQVATLLGGAIYGMNPYAQNMFMNAQKQIASDYATSQFHGPQDVGDNYIQFFRDQMRNRGYRG